VSNGANVIVIGGGVIGLSIARALKLLGIRDVCVLDKGAAGHEASWAAAGILAPQVEADVDDEFFKLCYESNRVYDDFAAALLEETGVDVELDRTGIISLAFDEKEAAKFAARFERQTAAGLRVERLTAEETRALEPEISPRACESLLFPNDGQVENRKLVEALVRFAELNGIEIRENVEVKRVLTESDRATGVELKNGETVESDAVVIATGAWTSFIEIGVGKAPVNVKPIRGQMISFGPPRPDIKHVIYSHRGYLVPRADGRLLAGATVEDVGFERTTTKEGIAGLKEMAVEIAPAFSNLHIADKWAGLRPLASGGYPVIGPVPSIDGLFVATGHYRNGILLAPITTRLIADAIEGNSSHFHETFGLR
jgi:glycine oxidase